MKSRISTILDSFASLAMIAASAAVIWFTVAARKTPAFPGPPTPPPAVEQVTVPGTYDVLDPSPSSRQPARVALIEFSDFECPFCGKFAREVLPNLQRDFVITGKVEHVFLHFPLKDIHKRAMAAAAAAECARHQGKYWEMHDRLFANQVALGADDLVRHAGAIGLDPRRMATCLEAPPDPAIETDITLAQQLGVSSTPTFFIGEIQNDRRVRLVRKIRGAQSYNVFKGALDEVLAVKGSASLDAGRLQHRSLN